MPPFPERESSILAKLKKRQPDKTKGKILEKENKTEMERPTPSAIQVEANNTAVRNFTLL